MAHDSRPLSPDLQIYRPQLTSVLSISHRVTGIALSVHSDRAKIPAVVAIRLACCALTIAGIFATLRIAFGG